MLNFFRNFWELNTMPMVDMWNDAQTVNEKIVAVFFSTWIAILLVLFYVGMTSLIYGLISGEADVANATFGIFDYCC
jgi:hypothetical protein